MDCVKAMGFIPIPDCNAPDAPPDGIVTLSLTLSERRERVSSFEAFLSRKVTSKRRNLTICTNTLVSRIVFTHDKGLPRSEKILFKSVDPTADKIFSAKVNKEVIVCSGAIGSPQVLMLRYVPFFRYCSSSRRGFKREILTYPRSGIGPREHLEEHGIKVVHNLPGVGSELVYFESPLLTVYIC